MQSRIECPGLAELYEQFWSIYTLDVYASVVFGGLIRHREALSAVEYPSEVLEDGTSSGISWIRGWNFTTDLYRVLEHIVNHSQQRTNTYANLFPTTFVPATVLAHIQSMYNALPAIFKQSHAMTGDSEDDRFTFQAANIIVTMQVRANDKVMEIRLLMSPLRCPDSEDGVASARSNS